MFNPIIHSKISLLGHVIDDIKHLEQQMLETSDPSLLLEYKQEMRDLIEELNTVSERCLHLIELYIRECDEQNVPVYLDYVRVYKELQKAKRVI